MARNAPPSVPVADLPEFMRSRTVAAIVAETLETGLPPVGERLSVHELIAGAAGELRSFHALPGAPADPTGIEQDERSQDERDADHPALRDDAFH